jgi:phosphonate transport system ATP-binding protein
MRDSSTPPVSKPALVAETTRGDEHARPVVAALDDAAVVHGRFAALRGVSLRIHAGERVAVIGPSGAGKSTLLRLLNTSLLPSAGRVAILGEDPARLRRSALRRLRGRIGTVWQQLHLVPQASVAENVRMGRVARSSLGAFALASLSRAERARVLAVLGQVELADRVDERVDRLSGGEQQRVAVARVLHQAPELLLADEPLASVDPARGAELLRLLLAAAAGRTLVVSTHQLEPVLPHFPRVVALRGGEVVFDRRRDEITADDLARLYRSEASAPSPDAEVPIAELDGRTTLRIAASTLPGDYLLPRVLPRFREVFPDVRVCLTVHDSEEAVEALRAGRADLALVGRRDPHPDLVFEDVAEDEIVLLAPPGLALPGEPIPLSAAARLPRVDREPGSATRRAVEEQLAAMGCPLDPSAQVFETGSPESVKAAVAAGAGVAFASRLSVADDLAAGRVRVIAVERLRIPRRIFAAVRRGEPPPAAARALLELLRRAAGGERT